MDNILIRSCWECNINHKHLKNSKNILYCFVCGKVYENGIEIARFKGIENNG